MAEASDGAVRGRAKGTGEWGSGTRLLVESGLPVSGVGEICRARIGGAGNAGETGIPRIRKIGGGNALKAGTREAWVR